MDRLFKCLNATKTLNDNLPKLIEVFVDFYGEENRKHIEETFSKMVFIGYQDIDDLSTLVNDIKHQKTKEYVIEAFRKYNISYDDNKSLLGFGNYIYDNIEIFPITYIAQFIKESRLGEEKRKELYLKDHYEYLLEYIPNLSYEDFINNNIKEEDKQLLPRYICDQLDNWINCIYCIRDYESLKHDAVNAIKDFDKSVTMDNIEEYIKTGKLDVYESIYDELSSKKADYESFYQNEVSKVETYVEKQKEYRRSLNNKYYLELINKYKHLLNEEDNQKLEEELNSDYPSFYSIKGLEIFMGTSLGATKTIEYFQEKCDKELLDPDTLAYRLKNIKEARIEYFKYKGIDLGDNYDDYVNNPRCQEVWPSKELIEDINSTALDCEDKANMELYSNLPSYRDILETLANLNLLDKDEIIQPANYVMKTTCVMPNIVKDETGYSLFNQVLIYINDNEFLDESIIHELNHLYELSLIGTNDNKYQCICGWDILNLEFNQDEAKNESTVTKDESKRDYELFNEIINELIAQKISKSMHEKGIFLLCDKDNYKDYGGTSYQHSAFIIRDFLEEYFEDIIASRKDGNIDIILNKVGKENFEALNELFHVFKKQFSEFAYYHLVSDLENNEDTELVRRFSQIKEKRDIILNNMREYSRRPSIFNL